MTSSLAFNGFDFTTQSSPRGGRFKVLEVTGWHSVTKRRDRQERMQQAGAYPSTGFAQSLPITARGTAVYPSAEAAALERRELVALAADSVPLTIVDAAGEWTRVVETDALVVDPVRDTMLSWSLVVTACDPNVYGPATFSQTTLAASAGGTGLTYPLTYPRDYGVPPGVTPGAITLANAGTASYHPRLRIDGGVTNPRITLAETGDLIALDFTIPEGQWVDINAGKPREVLLNGVLSLRNRVSYVGNWCAVPVGGGSLSWTADAFTSTHSLSAWGYEGAWS